LFYPTLDTTEAGQIDFLVFAAHPNDAELTCGGTLHRMARLGHRTGIIDLTTGDMSSRGLAQTRVEEAAKAAAILKVAWRGNLGMPDGRIENHVMARMTIAGAIRQLKPKLVVVPSSERRHPDHGNAARMIIEAAHVAGFPKLDDLAAPHRPNAVLVAEGDAPAQPDILVEITEDLSAKLDALACYESQYQGDQADESLYPSRDSLAESVRNRAAALGSFAKIPCAEGFWHGDSLIVEDLLSLKFTNGEIKY
jgi:bacillithiol biosynthesis deacetylase BshB1